MYLNRDNRLAIMALYLGGYQKQFYLRELSRLSKLSLKATQNATASLEKSRILKSNAIGKNKYFKPNLENIGTKFCLLQSEIYRTVLFAEKYPVFKTFLKEIKASDTIIVFGSFARFEAGKDSDLDLLTIPGKAGKLPFHLLPYKIHEIALSEASFRKALEIQETLIKEVEENHILLNNHSFYVNAMWNRYGK